MKDRKRTQIVSVLIVASLASYILLNLTLVRFVPLLHQVKIELSVIDVNSQAPIGGANVFWVHGVSSPHIRADQMGVTDSTGRLLMSKKMREQPTWALPRIGEFQFSDLTLRIEADGYSAKELHVKELIPHLPYRSGSAKIEVELNPLG